MIYGSVEIMWPVIPGFNLSRTHNIVLLRLVVAQYARCLFAVMPSRAVLFFWSFFSLVANFQSSACLVGCTLDSKVSNSCLAMSAWMTSLGEEAAWPSFRAITVLRYIIAPTPQEK